jgi:membrane peptidoglycan carboxypeptidase
MKRTTRISRISKRPPKKTSWLPLIAILSFASMAIMVFLVLAALVTTAGVAVYRYYQSVVPQGITTLTSYESQPFQVSLIIDRKGYTLQELVDPQFGARQIVALNKIPKTLITATIDTENRTFYTDPGVDPVRLLSAGVHDLRGNGGLQGASTLTEQLVKLAVFGTTTGNLSTVNSGALQTKLKEILISIGLTNDIAKCSLRCRKDAILQMYLNTVPYGDQTYGVEAAAEYYFDEHASQLDLAQSALLAGIPQAPSEYDPLYHLANGIARQHDVLAGMYKVHDITLAQYRAALAEQLHFVFKSPQVHNASNTIESYFVDWLVNVYLQDPQNLAQFHIPTLQQPSDIYRGYIFQTTLDPDLEALAQNTVTQQVSSLGYENVNDGALVSIDPKTNEILAFVGGIGYNAPIQCPQCDMAWLPRQPGSSFKPFMYVTAFENGQFPAETINDSYVQFPDSGEPGGYYIPKNYDLAYHGLVTIRQALANSYNVPAVKVFYSLGDNRIPMVLKTANSMGYHPAIQDPSKLGLSFTLGADPGRLLEETNAYTVFANNGVYRPYMPIMAIYRQNADGTRTLVWKYQPPKGVQVLAPQFSYLITNILADTAAKLPAFGQAAYDYLALGDQPAATKTGTTNDFKDNLTMGYTPDLVTGVWVGNPDDSPMINSTGITGAAPIWHAFMATALANTPIHPFIQPPGIITATVAMYAPAFSLPGLSSYGKTDIFAAGTLPKTFDQPSQDVYTTTPSVAPTQIPAPPAAGAIGSSQQCADGKPMRYTASYVNGKLVYQPTCT